MAKFENKKEKTSLQHRILIFLHRRGTIFLGILGILAAVIIILAVVNSANAKKLEADTRRIESIQDEYSKLITITDEKEKAEKEKKIIGELNSIIDKGTKNYPYQRALFILGNIQYNNGEYDKSAENFMKLVKYFSKSYLSPIALMDAAVDYEAMGQIDKAIENYQRVADEYKDLSPDADRSLFTIGRLYEEKGDTDAALKAYNSLIDTFPASNWTNLARSRIIYLETRK